MQAPSPFNTALEVGIRALALLDAHFPKPLDIQRLVDYDYLMIHSADAGGPSSLHPPLPLRASELLVRRALLERGLHLMMSRDLVGRSAEATGIFYSAASTTAAFMANLNSEYINKLKVRAKWVVEAFQGKTDDELRKLTQTLFKKWTTEFQHIESTSG